MRRACAAARCCSRRSRAPTARCTRSAQGNLAVGGAGASANGSKVQVNTLAAGRIAGGAIVERAVPTSVSQAGTMQLDLNDMDYDTTQRVVAAVNNAFGSGTATALDGRTIQLRAPSRSGAAGRRSWRNCRTST